MIANWIFFRGFCVIVRFCIEHKQKTVTVSADPTPAQQLRFCHDALLSTCLKINQGTGITRRLGTNLIAFKRNDIMQSVANMGRPQDDELNCLRTSGSMTICYIMQTESTSLNRDTMISQFVSVLMWLICCWILWQCSQSGDDISWLCSFCKPSCPQLMI